MALLIVDLLLIDLRNRLVPHLAHQNLCVLLLLLNFFEFGHQIGSKCILVLGGHSLCEHGLLARLRNELPLPILILQLLQLLHSLDFFFDGLGLFSLLLELLDLREDFLDLCDLLCAHLIVQLVVWTVVRMACDDLMRAQPAFLVPLVSHLLDQIFQLLLLLRHRSQPAHQLVHLPHPQLNGDLLVHLVAPNDRL